MPSLKASALDVHRKIPGLPVFPDCLQIHVEHLGELGHRQVGLGFERRIDAIRHAIHDPVL